MARWPALVLAARRVRPSLEVVERLLQLRAGERQAVEGTLLLGPSASQLTSRLLGPAHPLRTLARALLACARASFETDRDPHRILERDNLFDEGASLILKGATAPTSTANTPALLQQVVEAVVLG